MKVITPPCMMCGKTSEMEVDSVALHRWQNERVLIQLAFPDMTAPEREQLKTGTHPECWDLMFADEDDEDEDEDDGCPGHPDDDNSIAANLPMGETHYCDGSCVHRRNIQNNIPRERPAGYSTDEHSLFL